MCFVEFFDKRTFVNCFCRFFAFRIFAKKKMPKEAPSEMDVSRNFIHIGIQESTYGTGSYRTYRPECLEICTYMFFVCYAGDPMEWGPVYWRGAHQEAGQE